MSEALGTGSAWMLAVAALWRREVVRFVRQRSRVVGALATPIVFWFLLGSGLGRSFSVESGATHATDAQQMDYLEYFFPGALAMIVLFTAIFSTISIIEDRREGFLQGVIVAPVRRSAIVWGKVLGSSTLALLQAVLFLCLTPLAGISLGIGAFFATVGCLVPIALGLSALGLLIAWRMESTQGFHAIMNLFLMPIWILSGAVFPGTGSSAWVAAVMAVNPLTYGVAALRHALYIDADGMTSALPPMWFCLLVTVGFAVVLVAWCTRTVRRAE